MKELDLQGRLKMGIFCLLAASLIASCGTSKEPVVIEGDKRLKRFRCSTSSCPDVFAIDKDGKEIKIYPQEADGHYMISEQYFFSIKEELDQCLSNLEGE